MTRKEKSIDFNDLLRWSNLSVICGTLLTFVLRGGNQFIDWQTIVLAVVLGAQTHAALLLEKRQRDPFVLLLSLTMVFYFSLRIMTLMLYPYSVVFGRYPYGAGDSNFAAVFIIVANLFLYAGFFRIKTGAGDPAPDRWRPAHGSRALLIVFLSIVFAYSSDKFWHSDAVPRAVRFLEEFLSVDIIIPMALAYVILFRKHLSSKVVFSIVSLILIEAALHTFMGSRSAIVGNLKNFLIVLLATATVLRIPRHYFIPAAICLPIMLVALVASFTFATFARGFRSGKDSLSVMASVLDAESYSGPTLQSSNLDDMLAPIFDRAGFFDYSAEIIAHRDHYTSVINVPAYARSIVDNLLTPGFDVYDQPKISNALQFVYRDLGPPSKTAIETEGYQSDQLGLYGELYALFGYASLPLFFGLGCALKAMYKRLGRGNPFHFLMERVVLLFLFDWTINSYGFDWTIINLVRFGVSIYLYGSFFSTARIVGPPDLGSAGPLTPH